MDGYKKRFQLDKAEFGILLVVALLLSGMTFTLGVLFGFGLAPAGSVDGHGHSLTHSAESTLNSGDTKNHGQRHPASTAGLSEDEGVGRGLKSAFREAKQKALVDLVIKESAQQKAPKSVADTKAHLESNAQWNDRKPASVADIEEQEDVAAAKKVEEERGARGVPRAVTDLFERKPAAQDIFEATPGSFTVQVNSYSTLEEAQSRVRTLREAGVNDAYYSVIDRNGEKWFRVAVGSFPAQKWAAKTGEKLVRRKLTKDFLIRQVQ